MAKSYVLHENVDVQPAVAVTSITAGGAGDATKITGETIDLKGYHDLTIVFCGTATLGAGENLALDLLEIQQSDDGSVWDVAEDLVTAGGAGSSFLAYDAAGGTVQFSVKCKVPLNKTSANKRYIRVNPTPDMSAGSIDTASFLAVAVLGGKIDAKDTQSAGTATAPTTDVLLD